MTNLGNSTDCAELSLNTTNTKFKMSINSSTIKKFSPYVGIAVGGILAYKVYQNRKQHSNSSLIDAVQSEAQSLKDGASKELNNASKELKKLDPTKP